MKTRFFIKLNLFLALAFFIFTLIILFSIDPFDTSLFIIIIFYLLIFGFILCLLNSIRIIPFWFRILITIAIIFILIVLSF
ncbi:hypothetical protein KJ684_01935 [Patescibacteria group bacterium]|nr:hypothetical protein [Patescibacteria group bacterium]